MGKLVAVPSKVCYLDTVLAWWASGHVGRAGSLLARSTWTGTSKAIFSCGGSLVLLALSSLPYPWSRLHQGQTAAWHFPESPLRTPFLRIVLRLLGMNRAILKARPSFPSSFSFPVESSSLSSRAALSTVSENSGLKLPSDIKMEGQSLINDLAGWGPIRRKCCLGIPQPTHATNRVWISPSSRAASAGLLCRYRSTVRKGPPWQNFPPKQPPPRGRSTGSTGFWRLVRDAVAWP